jgi:hypothetical protein
MAWWQKPLAGLARVLLKTPEQGAATSIYLASSPEVEGISGKYFEDCKLQTSSAESYDVEIARRLWQISADMTGLDDAEPLALEPAAVASTRM